MRTKGEEGREGKEGKGREGRGFHMLAHTFSFSKRTLT